jgi:hypothetical protein
VERSSSPASTRIGALGPLPIFTAGISPALIFSQRLRVASIGRPHSMQARIINQRVLYSATFSVAPILRCANDVETHGLLGVAAIVPEALSATGWIAVDETARYWRHELRYGPAVFDRFEVDAIENGNGRRRHAAPRRALACRCRYPYGRLEEGTCLAYGRRAR